MEDEEGYTALQLKGNRKPEDEEGCTALQLKGRRKPEDEEGYTALQFKGRRKPEDEEGYTALQLKGRRKPEDEEGYTAVQLKGQRKPEDKERYTALQLKGKRKPEDKAGSTTLQFKSRGKPEHRRKDVPRGVNEQDLGPWLELQGQQCRRRSTGGVNREENQNDYQVPCSQRSALRIFVSLTLLLVLAVVGCGVWNFKLHEKNRDLMTTLKQRDECNASILSGLSYIQTGQPGLDWAFHHTPWRALDLGKWIYSEWKCVSVTGILTGEDIIKCG
ncbi:hypothetical protein NDU88_000601 [Pleurodeles waltl]|uniref:Uncharacterized protein n=1 Tax=Pleurodeles waltl TaxID=8319 RepID=A0AAV7P1H6_PLEWA|nr:hypothetical protein NDU88_000601 [Pleurodeles waltl]